MTNDLKWALKELLSNLPRYDQSRAYYEGRHPRVLTSEKLEGCAASRLLRGLSDNLCPAIVDTVADRLQVLGFTVPKAEGETDNPIEAKAREIWRRNRMNKRAGEVHQDGLVEGDSYIIAWPDKDNFPILYPNRADKIAIRFDDEQPGYITLAAKAWKLADGRYRVNLYYVDHIEKWVTKAVPSGGLPETQNAFIEYNVEGEQWPLANPYGKVPVFHFGNRAGVGELGRSQLHEAIPLQDVLNKSIADMLVAMEFYALPQRWATGLEDGDALSLKPGGMWYTEDEKTRFGEFSAGDLSKFLEVSEGFRKEIARVSRTPLHYFTMEGTMPSGEAMKTADAPLLSTVADRQIAWGNVWADVMRFALEITGTKDTDPDTVWKDVTPRSETEQVEIAEAKERLGVPQSQLLRELGYEVKEIEKFKQERATVDIVPDVMM